VLFVFVTRFFFCRLLLLWKFDFEAICCCCGQTFKGKLILIKDVMRGTMNVFLNERFSGDRQEEEERESESDGLRAFRRFMEVRGPLIARGCIRH